MLFVIARRPYAAEGIRFLRRNRIPKTFIDCSCDKGLFCKIVREIACLPVGRLRYARNDILIENLLLYRRAGFKNHIAFKNRIGLDINALGVGRGGRRFRRGSGFFAAPNAIRRLGRY